MHPHAFTWRALRQQHTVQPTYHALRGVVTVPRRSFAGVSTCLSPRRYRQYHVAPAHTWCTSACASLKSLPDWCAFPAVSASATSRQSRPRGDLQVFWHTKKCITWPANITYQPHLSIHLPPDQPTTPDQPTNYCTHTNHTLRSTYTLTSTSKWVTVLHSRDWEVWQQWFITLHSSGGPPRRPTYTDSFTGRLVTAPPALWVHWPCASFFSRMGCMVALVLSVLHMFPHEGCC